MASKRSDWTSAIAILLAFEVVNLVAHRNDRDWAHHYLAANVAYSLAYCLPLPGIVCIVWAVVSWRRRKAKA